MEPLNSSDEEDQGQVLEVPEVNEQDKRSRKR